MRKIIIYLFLILTFICSCSGKNNTASDWIEKEKALWDGRQYADPEKAVEYLNNAIKLQQNNVTAYNKRGNAYTQLGQHQKAIEDYKEAILLKPDDLYAYYNMACCFAIQKKGKQACHYLTLAIERGFGNWTYLEKDKDFNNIRNTACFIDILNKSGK